MCFKSASALAFLFAAVTAAAAEDSDSRLHHVDLQSHVNQPLDEDFLPGDYPGDSLSELARGDCELGGIPFRIGDDLVQVSGKFLPDHPTRVEDIEVGQHAKRIHFLHAARWGAYGSRGDSLGHWVADGTPIGYYEVVYEDGSAEAIPIIYGVDVRDWWSIWDNAKATERGKVVWTGNNPHLRQRSEARHTDTPLRLYLSTWENPRPEARVASIEFVSLGQAAAPFCVAMTAEKSDARFGQQILNLEREVERLTRELAKLKKQFSGEVE
ncbi:MAG: hypothetical protein WD851_11280 [Pirellulales bacterium]